MYNTIVTLKKGEGRTLKAGGMCVFYLMVFIQMGILFPFVFFHVL